MHISNGHSLFLFVEARETRPHLKAMDSGHRHTKPKSIRGRMLLINRILLQSIRGRQAFSLDQVREVVRTFSIKYEPQGWRNRNHRASKCPNLPCGLPLCAPPSADRKRLQAMPETHERHRELSRTGDYCSRTKNHTWGTARWWRNLPAGKKLTSESS